MPWYLDRHDAPGLTPEAVAAAHLQDLAIQDRYNVRYASYWFDPAGGSVFCLAEGPSRDAVNAVHRDGHGLEASTIIELEYGDMQAFLGPPPVHPPGEAYVAPSVRAILFTDICNSTALTQTLGDAGAMAILRDHDSVVRSALERQGGREVKHTGDGIMASFTSVASSVDAAVAIQAAVRDRNGGTETVPIDLRIGIAAGEPIAEGEDLFGAAVQLAARLCAAAPPAGIVVSVAVRELCIGKAFRFQDLGPLELKGFSAPTPAFAVLL
jgi:class 3 adenylate cyclase